MTVQQAGPFRIRVVPRVQLQNPTANWLRRIRIDYMAYEATRKGRTVYTGFYVPTLAPYAGASQVNGDLIVYTATRRAAGLSYHAMAKVVGGYQWQKKGP